METEKESVGYEAKGKFKLPEDAELIKKSSNIEVREIENGFILRKSYNIEYRIDGHTDYAYHSKEWYSKKNPLKVEMVGKKYLADNFDE